MMAASAILVTLQLLAWSHIANSSAVQCIYLPTMTDCSSLIKCSNNSRVVSMPNSSIHINGTGQEEFEIYFCSNNASTINITFVNVQSVLITGRPDGGSQINCSKKNYNGLRFINVSTVELSQFTLNQCYHLEKIKDTLTNSSIFIHVSTHVSIQSVGIWNSAGIGMAIVECNGYLSVTSSTFEKNYASNYVNSGCGLFIESTLSEAEYNIRNCNFTRNGASNQSANENRFLLSRRYDVVDFVRGGAMNVYFRDYTSNVNMTISDCRFIGNQARHGGALSLAFQASARNVDVRVISSLFENNTATERGGAAIAGYIHDNRMIMSSNKILFSQCNFSYNDAMNGGGLYLYAAPNYFSNHSGEFKFQNCLWLRNKAKSGVALLILPYYISKSFFQNKHLPTPVFENCSILNNTHPEFKNLSENHAKLMTYGKGILFANALNILIKGDVKFIDNNDSAVYLISCNLIVDSNSLLLFERNHGYQGGAVRLDGFASISVRDNVTMKFYSNRAFEFGGAIYHGAVYELNHLMMKENCFLKTSDASNRNVYIEFENNTVHTLTRVQKQTRGQTLFLFSTIPCNDMYQDKNDSDFYYTLNQIAHVEFKGGIDNSTIGTYSSKIFLHESLPIKLTPGIKKKLNITVIDDMKTIVENPIIHVKIIEGDEKISIDSSHVVVTNNKVKVYGQPGSKGAIKLALFMQKDMSLQFRIALNQCPPGYVYDKKTNSCQCSANVERPFMGITKCNLTSHRAVLVPGFWPGYIMGKNTSNYSHENFRTSLCPFGYCTTDYSNYDAGILLPTRPEFLSASICSSNREGRVCAKCKAGTSVFYHTVENFECHNITLCNIGIFLYMISEIVPVTALFLIIILFDVQLTTGPLNGFLLYMQLLNTVFITRTNLKDIPKVTKILMTILHGIAKLFNLKFFVWPGLSFCLLEDMNSLDLLAFEYVTIVYSLVLTLLTVLFMNLRCYKIRKMRQTIRENKVIATKSIVHGLSGFLVLCYSRSTVTTLKILSPNALYSEKETSKEWTVLYYGEYNYFDSNHKKYAIPALFALTFMTCLPPLLLLVYPLCYKVLALIKLEESKFAKVLCKFIPLEKFKPFFDSFQGGFKDNHRYFAGLYFIYRLLALLFQVTTSTSTGYYYFLGLQIFIMIVIHFWINPYKVKWHNKVDLFFFSILMLTIGITLYYYQELDTQYVDPKTIGVLSTIKVILAYIPLLYILIYGIYKLKIKLQAQRKKDDCNSDLELSLSTLSQDRQEQKGDIGYHKLD